jgi:hypothetical protein
LNDADLAEVRLLRLLERLTAMGLVAPSAA